MRRIGLLPIFILLAGQATAEQDVANTVHNLSASGPGTFTSLTVDEVCVFCHTPHNAAPDTPLWNHTLSGQTYTEYDSSTLQALPGQPTGSSRLCLACHDGTVALGALTNLPAGQTNDLATTFLSGRADLGTDLADDHPISFLYDGALSVADGELAHPAAIALPLQNEQLQCTSCHDPHERDVVPFLHLPTANGELCTTCHIRGGATWSWPISSHATSPALSTGIDNPWAERKPEWRGLTVAENACFNCHTPHNAETPQRLVKDVEEETCYLCHDGTVAATDIRLEQLSMYRHPVETTPNPDHDAALVEDPQFRQFHVECMDCHNPHAVRDDLPMVSFNPVSPLAANHTVPPAANGLIQGVPGIDANGNVKREIDFQYELCFGCHGVPGRSACDNDRCRTALTFSMDRQDGVYNIRDKVYSGTPGLVSYHPIEFNNPTNNTEVPSLRTDIPLNRSTSLIYCTDCHNGEQSAAAGGPGPNGPHGSNNGAILALRYSFDPKPNYSPSNYEVCYRCHSETAILNDASGFPHRLHVESEEEACIGCHDPHGSHAFEHLLNFLTTGTYGGQTWTITGAGGFPDPVWQDDGRYLGTCYMDCHNEEHDGRVYN